MGFCHRWKCLRPNQHYQVTGNKLLSKEKQLHKQHYCVVIIIQGMLAGETRRNQVTGLFIQVQLTHIIIRQVTELTLSPGVNNTEIQKVFHSRYKIKT